MLLPQDNMLRQRPYTLLPQDNKLMQRPYMLLPQGDNALTVYDVASR